jgi:hypothetical protein
MHTTRLRSSTELPDCAIEPHQLYTALSCSSAIYNRPMAPWKEGELTLNGTNQPSNAALSLARRAVDSARSVASSLADLAGRSLRRALDLGQALGRLGLDLCGRVAGLLLCGAGGLGGCRGIAQAGAADGEPRLADERARYSERHCDGCVGVEWAMEVVWTDPAITDVGTARAF